MPTTSSHDGDMLIKARASKATESKQPAEKKEHAPISALTSTLKEPSLKEPKRLDTLGGSRTSARAALKEPARFSARSTNQGSGNAGRIILYVIIVVVVGIGLTLLLQNYITNQQNQASADDNLPSNEEQVTTPAEVVLASTIKADAQVQNITPNASYTATDSSLGSASNDVSAVKVAKLTHDMYTSFTRTTWELSGVTGGLPAIMVSYASANKTISVRFSGIDVVNQEMLDNFAIVAGNVMTIEASKEGTVLVFELVTEAASKYFVSVSGGNTLVLDIKSEAKLTEPTISSSASSSASTSSAASSTSSTSSSAGAVKYDNTPSQTKQYIVSDVTGNVINNNTYYYVDYGDSFQFSWALGNAADHKIPNASAELITEDGTNYIEVKINNLAYDSSYAKGRTVIPIEITTAGSSLVDVEFKSFSGGTATYWVELRKKTNFRLHSTIVYNDYQLVSIQVMD